MAARQSRNENLCHRSIHRDRNGSRADYGGVTPSAAGKLAGAAEVNSDVSFKIKAWRLGKNRPSRKR
jgi:hypothetical protein